RSLCIGQHHQSRRRRRQGALRRRTASGRTGRPEDQRASIAGGAQGHRRTAMMRAAAGSLRTKLLIGVLLTTLVALVFALMAMIAFDIRQFHQSELADIQTQAELLGRTTAPALAFGDRKAARENLELLRFSPDIHAAAVYDEGNKLFASYEARAERH